MTILICVLALTAIVAHQAIRRMGTYAFPLLATPLFVGTIWSFNEVVRLYLGGQPRSLHYPWIPLLNLNIDFRLGPLEALFATLVLGIGTIILIYCTGYFHNPPRGQRRRLGYFSGQLVGFAAAMFGLVISDNMLLMYVFWEATSVLSFLLVGYYAERSSSRRAATQALMVTTLGGLIMLVGLILLGQTTSMWKFSELATIPADTLSEPRVAIAVVLLIIGALSKSAIAPLHFWLPSAMAAPTPVSAFLHSAAMVKAGVFLVAKLSPIFATTAYWHLAIIPLGILTLVMAGWMALRQKDLKLILAYGTVSQLGFIMAITAIGTRAALLAGLALTLGHALFKAPLFMVVGAIDHCTGTRDIRTLSGLGRRTPQLVVIACLAGASMAGVPPLFGFVAKEAALESVLHAAPLAGMPGIFTAVGVVIGSTFTAAYTLFALWGAFATKDGRPSEAVATMSRPSAWMVIPAGIPAVIGLIAGLAPHVIDAGLTTYLHAAFPNEPGHTHLALWHGFSTPLLLTAVILTAGYLMFRLRHLVALLHFDKPALGDANEFYDTILSRARTLSTRVTATTQRGSLPLTEAIVMLVLIALPMSTLLLGSRDDLVMTLWDSPMQGAAAFIMAVTALAATRVRNRLSGLIMVGVTGYGLALMFTLQGAPDLALTQLLAETITVVIFVLVLRTLPARTRDHDGEWVRARAWLAVGVGMAAVTVGAYAMASRRSEPISDDIPDLAYDIGHGANAVNVLLVDIRAWDTFGETAVLVIAAIGIASLVFRTHTVDSLPRPVRRSRKARRTDARWLATTDAQSERGNQPLLLLIATRLLFPSMMVLSLYLFFAGHNSPGGGFAGGLVAALAITLRYIAGGRWELDEAVPVPADALLGSGLVCSATSVAAPILVGWPPLTSAITEFEVPLIGEVAVVSPLLFDAGVYLIVVGTVTYMLRSLGGRLDVEADRRAIRARSRRISLTKLGRTRRHRSARTHSRKAAR
ncbi:Na+/H+ antiporter subunit A [Corynebacterium sp. TAE3-ERU12]|uniref:Na+/H+ antiporter subunit A n=1 Tax=Corynebacterium sp. TAE3-ERU12 TaxID=2849491 RepID=UPI001C48F7A0|nr:Na+/H+ antiporter subunit A [Corynebacterium sp. TAE3-ERU12]MBV7295955.1 Na+/H+ antiporter subunit A [Corynebacterium sp. TAE3-ERU12]